MTFEGLKPVRAVHHAEILRRLEGDPDLVLDELLADKVPYFYRPPSSVARNFGEGYFISAIRETLRRLPTAENFQESHFGEILAAIYAEDVLGLRKLYSKLTLLTAENANAYKMDVLLYRPNTDPVVFVFSEVKSSTKTADDGLPAGHDKSCFASLFRSLNGYRRGDLQFDLDLIKEHLAELPEEDTERIRRALLPHQPRHIEYGAYCVIDNSTQDPNEAKLLATRANKKSFEVDLLCVTELPDVVESVFRTLDRLRGD